MARNVVAKKKKYEKTKFSAKNENLPNNTWFILYTWHIREMIH